MGVSDMAYTPWKRDIDVTATFADDGRTETLWEITNEDHSETFAYAVDEDSARLIEAAPDLLEALVNITNVAENMRTTLESGASWVNIPNAYFNQAWAAIDKATGS
jgi:hypothetical protein